MINHAGVSHTFGTIAPEFPPRVTSQQPYENLQWSDEVNDLAFQSSMSPTPNINERLAQLGVPASDIAAMSDPTVRRVLSNILDQGKDTGAMGGNIGTSGDGGGKNKTAPSAPRNDRPKKRIRPDADAEVITIHLKFPRFNPPVKPPPESIANIMSDARLELTMTALKQVKLRLVGKRVKGQAKPMDLTTDPELKVYLDYEQGVITAPESGVESDAERAERTIINRLIWNTFREQYETDIKAHNDACSQSKGYRMFNGVYERPNDMASVAYLWEPIAWNRDNNTVYYGEHTGRMIQHIANRTHTVFCGPEMEPVYQCAPRGFPRSLGEINKLKGLCSNKGMNPNQRIGAYTLLRAFYNASKRTDAINRDEAMNQILDIGIYDPSYYPECMARPSATLPFEMMPPSLKGRRDGANDGYGLSMPSDPFNIIDWATYFLVHQPVGSHNKVNGLNMDYAGRIRLENVYAHLLVRAIGPPHSRPQARARYTMHFAYLVARPHLYEERIDEYNTREPDRPFVEAPGPEYDFVLSTLTDAAANNCSSEDVSNHLIQNGVPVNVINHCYAYGRQFLDQTFYNIGRVHVSREIDQERLDRLQRFGQPPVMDAWSGWYTPSYDTIRRMKYIYNSNTRAIDLTTPYWTKYGADHAPISLASVRGTPTFDLPTWTGHDHHADREDGQPPRDTPEDTAMVIDHTPKDADIPESPLTDTPTDDEDDTNTSDSKDETTSD